MAAVVYNIKKNSGRCSIIEDVGRCVFSEGVVKRKCLHALPTTYGV